MMTWGRGFRVQGFGAVGGLKQAAAIRKWSDKGYGHQGPPQIQDVVCVKRGLRCRDPTQSPELRGLGVRP